MNTIGALAESENETAREKNFSILRL